MVKRIYANWRLKCGENRRLKLNVVGETGPQSEREEDEINLVEQFFSFDAIYKTCPKLVDDR